MKKLLACGAVFFLLAGNAFAEDAIAPVFDQLDNLLIRVESGISLNSFAESLAKIKIDYKPTYPIGCSRRQAEQT